MNENYDKIEEELKKKSEPKKEKRVSGKSVFKLQEIIQQKAVSSEVERKKKSESSKKENQDEKE